MRLRQKPSWRPPCPGGVARVLRMVRDLETHGSRQAVEARGLRRGIASGSESRLLTRASGPSLVFQSSDITERICR